MRNIVPPLGHAWAKKPERDFGILRTRGFKIKQTQADVYNQNGKQQERFDKMTHERLLSIIEQGSLEQKRRLSRWFFKHNGMYARAVRYLSDIYKFDYMIYPSMPIDEQLKESRQKKIVKKWDEVLDHFESSMIQLFARKWASQVCIDGCYYGYVCDDISDRIIIQDLPSDYCRSQFIHRGLPLVEFNVQYFDKITTNETDRKKILSLFPQEIQKGYRHYKNNNNSEKDAEWIILDMNRAFKFSFVDDDTPPFLVAIPALIELGEVQDLEKEKLLQQIQKILVQVFDLDKNGQIPFSMTELQQLNQNATDMVGDAVGVSVLSTIANVHLEDLAPSTGKESTDNVSAAKDDVYSNFGISTNLFNTSGNLALDKSIIIDEAFVKPLLLQIEAFFNRYLDWNFNTKDLKFRLKTLTTSIFNYKDLSKIYENLTKLGFSRFLPMVALGHTQKEIISLARLEQQALNLDLYMMPPFSSNTMSSDTWLDIKTSQQTAIGNKDSKEDTAGAAQKAVKDIGGNEAGRPALPDDQKSDKTIANRASQ